MISEIECRSPSSNIQIGCLVVAGVGITALSQVTPEVRSQIKAADIVFYHATSGVMAAYIGKLNSNTVDLYQCYGEGKRRRRTYIQMAELLLCEVRKGRRVVGVFHGHPSFFVMATRRACAIARRHDEMRD